MALLVEVYGDWKLDFLYSSLWTGSFILESNGKGLVIVIDVTVVLV